MELVSISVREISHPDNYTEIIRNNWCTVRYLFTCQPQDDSWEKYTVHQ
jgi:hypothetical protein